MILPPGTLLTKSSYGKVYPLYPAIQGEQICFRETPAGGIIHEVAPVLYYTDDLAGDRDSLDKVRVALQEQLQQHVGMYVLIRGQKKVAVLTTGREAEGPLIGRTMDTLDDLFLTVFPGNKADVFATNAFGVRQKIDLRTLLPMDYVMKCVDRGILLRPVISY